MYDVRMQLSLLLNDVRNHVWSPERRDRTLILLAGVKTVPLPADHVQTFALLRSPFSVSACFLDPLGAPWRLDRLEGITLGSATTRAIQHTGTQVNQDSQANLIALAALGITIIGLIIVFVLKH